MQHPKQALDTTALITPPIKGIMSSTLLKKDVAGIQTKNNPYTENTRLTQTVPGSSHIKTPL